MTPSPETKSLSDESNRRAEPISNKDEAGHDPGDAGGEVSKGEKIPSDGQAEAKRATRGSPTASAAPKVPEPPAQPERKTWSLRLNPLRWGAVPKVPDGRAVSAEYRASLFSKLTFHWMTPLMVTGYKRCLRLEDICLVNPDRGITPLTNSVEEKFHRFVRNGRKHPLLWALYETSRFEIWLGGLCALVGTVLRVVSAFVLRSLIKFASNAYSASVLGTPMPPISHGIALVIGITAMLVAQSFFMNHFLYHGQVVGGQSRGVLIGLIYEKALVISTRAKSGARAQLPSTDIDLGQRSTSTKEEVEAEEPDQKCQDEHQGRRRKDGIGWGNGSIVNLMSVHASRIEKAMSLFHVVWTSPIACVFTLAFVIINLSYCALPGFGLLVIGLPMSTLVIRGLARRRKTIHKVTDQRVSLIQEVLYSIRNIKYLCWEGAFMGLVEELRSKEIHDIQVSMTLRNVINATNIVLPPFASMLSLIAYSMSGHALAPARVFSTVALFNNLRAPLNMFPLALGQVTDAWTSLRRIEEFLLEEEQEELSAHKSDDDTAIHLRDASFTWETDMTQESITGNVVGADSLKKRAPDRRSSADNAARTLVEERKPFELREINFNAKRGDLIAVIGSVGSGKSSLLAALAAEMRRTGGNVALAGSRAFCSQHPWIQNTTVQNNITFGKEMDKEKYKRIIEACALQADLDLLPQGDQTGIGERGITISGGQKQRLNIARAIYSDADIVLLDDPLSAVDTHVGRHIFHNAIAGLLKPKCRILVTHHLWVLSYCDRIIWMEDGYIQADDTYENLMQHHQGFQNLMESTVAEDKHAERKDVNATVASRPKRGLAMKAKRGGALLRKTEKRVASIPWRVYGAYARASGSMANLSLVLVILLLTQAASIATSIWLSYWTSDKFKFTIGQYVGVYCGLNGIQAIIVFVYSILVSVLGSKASERMLHDALQGVMRAPMAFFDTTPLGGIMSRFSSDVDVLDNQLAGAIRLYLFTLATVGSIFVLIVAFFHYFAIALLLLSLLFVGILSYYRKSARELARLESIWRPLMFAKFSEGLSGVAAIRAYGLRGQFVEVLRGSIDELNSIYFLSFSSQRWLALRLDMIGNALFCALGALVIASRSTVPPSIGGLVLSYIIAIIQMLQLATRQLADMESGMDSVERLYHYATELKQEAPLRTVEPSKSWPDRGEIIFEKVKMQYRENLPLVLRGLSLHVRSGERMAIVGRTGAGKSSIMSALFRLVEMTEGSISIDGVNISTVGLQDLRSRLTIIPQEASLFRGTLRKNLDPVGDYADDELWSALRQVGLASTEGSAANGEYGLNSVVEQDGANFSLGQRQLIALARALLRRSSIVLCDEATSAVDMETDSKIQRTMATAFGGRTLLCIAHRLRTVIGYDRVCVVDEGQVAEVDSPGELWRRGGSFRGMCDGAGIGIEDIEGAQRAGLERR